MTEARWLLGTALIDLEEWERADAVLIEAIRAYRRMRRTFEAKRARMTRVRLLRASGADPRRYLTVARRVFRTLTLEDRLRQPSFYQALRGNLPLYQLEAGDPRGAFELWKEIPRDTHRLLNVRRIGLGAVIRIAMGEVGDEEDTFRYVIGEFKDMGMKPDAAYFLLHLGELRYLTGRFHESRRSLTEAVTLFKESDLGHYSRVAVLRLEAALRAQSGLRAAIREAMARASGIVRRHGPTGS